MSPMPDGGRDTDERVPLRPDEAKGSDDGSALSPDELDIEEEEQVVSLDDDRYVIGTDDRPSVPDDAGGGGSTGESSAAVPAADDDPTDDAPPAGEVDSGAVKQWLEDDLQGVSAQYGFHVSAKAEDAVSHQQMFSDDVGTVFDSLLRWYAQQLTTETAVEDVLGILLTESNVRVRYSPSCLQAILEAYDLGPDDTIADLFEKVQDDRGMVFPPENV
ncbi:DUF7500 family protein [Halorussus caseinilyticus]|uniref:Flagella cluster protein n=1 Tax=Halorussus caseinilyticus TaxID=3034025 RepID=A0ABD5WHJ7_9EURY|nr:hypothetical protein [Halorussus sp. DT72]